MVWKNSQILKKYSNFPFFMKIITFSGFLSFLGKISDFSGFWHYGAKFKNPTYENWIVVSNERTNYYILPLLPILLMVEQQKSSLSNSQQTLQTRDDRKASISLLSNSTDIIEKPFSNELDLVNSLSLLNEEEKKIVDKSVCWFIEYENNAYLVQSNTLHEQLIPRKSIPIRSKSSQQLLRISAIKGGSI